MNSGKPILMLCCILGSFTAFAQGRFEKEMYQLNRSIEEHFLITGKNYYREHAVATKNEREVSFLWPLCGLVQAANEMEIVTGKNGAVNRIMEIITNYYDNRQPAPGYASYPPALGGGDRFYDDNQWIGISLMDAWSRTKDSLYLKKAEMIYRFMMTGFDTVSGGGLYWEEPTKKTKNTCSNGPGIILAMQLHKATGNSGYLDTAVLLFNWVNKHLQAPDGLYWDNISVVSGKTDKRKFSYNTGTMLQSCLYLYEATGNKEYLQQAERIANASVNYFYGAGKFRDNYWFNVVLLRAYQHLLEHSEELRYIKAFTRCVNNALQKEKLPGGLMGKQIPANLVGQSGMLEILARLAILEKKYQLEEL